MDEWFGLKNFMTAMTYWANLQESMVADGSVKSDPRSTGLVYLDGNSVLIPSRFDASTAEMFTNYAIRQEDQMFSVRESGRADRGYVFDNAVRGWFGTFDDSAKYFFGSILALSTRLTLRSFLDPIQWRWSDSGLPAEWSSRDEPDPAGITPATRFFRTDDPTRFYFTNGSDTPTAWQLDLTWDELVVLCSDGIPAAAHVARPVFDSP